MGRHSHIVGMSMYTTYRTPSGKCRANNLLGRVVREVLRKQVEALEFLGPHCASSEQGSAVAG